jgi:hypothetical protein
MKTVALLGIALLGVPGAGCSRTTELLPATTAACSGLGPPVHIGGTGPQSCSGALAARFGRYALCSCNDLILTSGGLFVGGPGGPPGHGPAEDLDPGAPAPRAFTASVGTDGNLRIGTEQDPPGPMTAVAGSLVTAGNGRATFAHGGHVQGNLRGAGSFTTMTSMGVWVSGEMVSGGEVSGLFKVVGGPLHIPPGAALAAEVQSMGLAREEIPVPPPCGCGATPALDLPAAIAERKTKNANASLPFADELLTTDVRAPQTLDLPCGEYYLSAIQTMPGAPITLRVHGRAALFVAGDVRLGDNFAVALDDGAELDLVVAGAFDTRGRVFGAPMAPARMRLWAASRMMALPEQIQFGAFVYAPNAVFSAGANLSFSGSLFVNTVLVTGDVRVAYDPTVTLEGDTCGVPPPPRVD